MTSRPDDGPDVTLPCRGDTVGNMIAPGLRLVVRLHVDLMRTCGMRCLTV
jgi:hypothetical protein